MTLPKTATIQQIARDLWLISPDLGRAGFSSFISAWLLKKKQKTFLIDVGPASGIPQLAAALSDLGVKRPDAIFLTHIHLDHAGGAGHFAALFPGAPIFCHPSAIRHLADPASLWEGSVKALGEVAEMYGPVRPVPENRLFNALSFGEKEISVLETPGHAPHHVSLLAGSRLFAGESGGVFIDLGDDYWLRPGTPPRFFLEKALKSIETLQSVPHDLALYCHFGWTRRLPRLLERHKSQLLLWADVIGEEMDAANGPGLVSRCFERLLKEDPCLSAWDRLEPGTRERERFFMENSVRGFVGFHRAGKGE
ncbi:conserved hypothetical protein [Candidatus Desulfarcum epimagneticum]|uniref:Metallo-beta-lactamase domain-containing protein n=1 Tax=uncultured Desulfobacteraceae bacterium TaxID=218296 RepID=A0A484HHG6_9BACT|nr:conserved hypothetical protein [uncultured Desulfobacteraceae bacterium]